MKLAPRRLQAWIFRGTLAITVACTGYLMWRYESVTLPSEGCSPVLRFLPGQRLIVDRRPRSYAVGDAVFFESPDARIHLGLVEEVLAEPGDSRDERQYQIGTDAKDCPGVDSHSLGAIPGERCKGRVLMIWPFGG